MEPCHDYWETHLLQVASRVHHMAPKAFILENVPRLLAGKHRGYLLKLLKVSCAQPVSKCSHVPGNM